MKLLMFTIRDTKAAAYLPPFCLHKRAVAVRAFADCVNSESHQFSKNAHDYTLFEIGEFDDETGMVSWQPPTTLGNGIEFLIEEKKQNLELVFDPQSTE